MLCIIRLISTNTNDLHFQTQLAIIINPRTRETRQPFNSL